MGYEIVERNYFGRMGEIDIVCKEGGYLIFAEVKYRKDIRMGFPEEAISMSKKKHIILAAQNYLYERNYPLDTSVRFDVVVILGDNIRIIQNAFQL